MGTGLIFAAVVIAWAVFLVPWALRRYEEATRARSVEKFSQAMRVLGRAGRGVGGKAAGGKAAAEPEPEPVATRPSLRTKPAEPTVDAPIEPAPRPSRAAARAAAHRRRRVLLYLTGATVVVGALAALTLIPGWSVLTPLALVVSFLALCRWQVRREDDAAWDRRRVGSTDATTPAGDEPDDEPTVVLAKASAEGREGVEGRQGVQADAEPVADADLAESSTIAVTVSTDDGRSLWDPLPVTLPTYVSKAKATRTVRTIDLGEPDTWTSGRVEGEQTELPSDASASGAGSTGKSSSDSSDSHQRAVGD